MHTLSNDMSQVVATMNMAYRANDDICFVHDGYMVQMETDQSDGELEFNFFLVEPEIDANGDTVGIVFMSADLEEVEFYIHDVENAAMWLMGYFEIDEDSEDIMWFIA